MLHLTEGCLVEASFIPLMRKTMLYVGTASMLLVVSMSD
jgi:hypothetical protein